MPFPNFHACRLIDPDSFDRFRVTKAGRVQIILGHMKDGSGWKAQAIRYPIEEYTEGEARMACDERKGILFEPATKETNMALHEFQRFGREDIDDEKVAAALAGELLQFADDLKTENIFGVTIFASGTWTDSAKRKRTYTDADLDEMVRNSRELGEKVKPFVKLMHLNPKDHLKVTAKPALGWVTNLRRVGSKLVADFLRMPQKIAQLLRAGAFRRVSSEIFTSWTDETTGKRYKNIVSAVGLLGAVHPAVSTVDDVMKLYGMKPEDGLSVETISADGWAEGIALDGHEALAFYEAEFMTEEEKNKKNKLSEGGEIMDPQELAKFKADLLKDLKDDFGKELDVKMEKFQAPIREALGVDKDGDVVKAIKELSADKTKAVKELGDRETVDFEAKITEVIDEAKKKGVIAPAQEHGIRLMVEGWVEKVDDTGKFELKLDDKKTVTGTVVENLKAYFEALPVKYEHKKERGALSEIGGLGIAPLPMAVRRELGGSEVPSRVVGMNVNDEVLSYAKDNKCDFMTAFTAVTGVTPAKEPEVGDYTINDATGEMHRT